MICARYILSGDDITSNQIVRYNSLRGKMFSGVCALKLSNIAKASATGGIKKNEKM